jgi:hypothetical protein
VEKGLAGQVFGLCSTPAGEITGDWTGETEVELFPGPVGASLGGGEDLVEAFT